MKDKKLYSVFIFFTFFFLNLFIGCSKNPILTMPESPPPIVRDYKHIKLFGNSAGMMSTGIYLKKGDLYSILAEGTVNIRPGRRTSPSERLYTMIGKSHYFPALPSGIHTAITAADYSGNLYLGILDGGFTAKGNALNPDRYKDNSGSFRVDILVWASDDILQIENFLVELEKKNPGNLMLSEFRNQVGKMKCDEASRILETQLNESDDAIAIKYLKKAIGYCPGMVEAYDTLGNIFLKKGEKSKAIEFLTTASDIGSTKHDSYFLLAELLYKKGDYNEAHKYIKKSLNINRNFTDAKVLKDKIEKEADREGPKIMLFEPLVRRGIKVLRVYDNLTVRGVAIDKSGVSWVQINKLNAELDKQGNFLKDIPIQVGINTLVVEAADRYGNQSRISVTIEGQKSKMPKISKIDSFSQMNELYSKSFAVVIGIDRYENWPALEFAAADAAAVKRKLEKNGFDEIVTILDEEATRRRILTELFHELPQRTGRNDRVVFYFAGHGQTEDLLTGGKRGYLLPVDADTSDYPKTAISMEQIRSLSSRIPAKHILYVMDSCYSGLGLNRSTGVSPKISDYLKKVSSMRVVQIITAGGKGEQVQERAGHGLFTTHFLEALDGKADFNQDNVVTGTELGAYLRPTVSNASQQAQTPLFGRLEGEGEFLFFVGKR
jgi:tetratricopeptide (TPR) repeat protein